LTNPKNPGHNGVRDNAGLAAFSADLLKDREHWSQAAVAANDVADFLATTDDTTRAVQWYRRAVEARPDYADAYQALGHLYSEEGNAIEAAAAYEKAVALDPSFKSSFNKLGNAYALIGDLEKSRAAYERAVALDPHFLEAQLNLANLYATRGELNSAKSIYERVLRSDPSSLEAVRSLGEVAAREGRFDDADRYFSRAVALAPQDKQNQMILARYHFSRGNLMEAKTHLESGMEPGDIEGYLLKSQILIGLNKPADAVDVLEQGVRAVPSNAELEGNLGSVYLKLGRVNEAEAHLQRAIRLDPNFSDAYEALADIWEKRDPAIARMYRNHVRK
jgi:protein O-GlcNAc transferase